MATSVTERAKSFNYFSLTCLFTIYSLEQSLQVGAGLDVYFRLCQNATQHPLKSFSSV